MLTPTSSAHHYSTALPGPALSPHTPLVCAPSPIPSAPPHSPKVGPRMQAFCLSGTPRNTRQHQSVAAFPSLCADVACRQLNSVQSSIPQCLGLGLRQQHCLVAAHGTDPTLQAPCLLCSQSAPATQPGFIGSPFELSAHRRTARQMKGSATHALPSAAPPVPGTTCDARSGSFPDGLPHPAVGTPQNSWARSQPTAELACRGPSHPTGG